MKSKTPIDQHRSMTESPMPTLLLRLALPTTVGMVLTSLYSLADAFFVSSLGTEASAAVGVTFAIQALIQAVGYTLGLGAGSLMSRRLGERRDKEAAEYARIAFWGAIVSGCAILGLGLLFAAPILRLLGATEGIFPYALAYARNLFLSTPFMCTAFVLSQLLRAEGKAIESMLGLVAGSLLNILLDPLLIHTLGMGIAGASLATLLSQAASVAVLLSSYRSGRSRIAIFHKPTGIWKRGGEVLFTGLPSAARQGLTVLATVLLNRAAGAWGDAAVAAISIVTRLFLLAFSLCLGIGQGMMPIAGYNFGFQKPLRVRRVYLLALMSASLCMLLIGILFYAIAPQLIGFFRNDEEVIRIGSYALRVQCAVFFCHGLITCTIMLLQAIGARISSTVLATARQGMFFLPLITLLPTAIGDRGILLVQPLADALTFLLALGYAIWVWRVRLRSEP